MKKKWFIGIDISKKTLDVVLYSKEKGKRGNYLKVSNNLSGFKRLSDWLLKKKILLDEVMICMEHTGIYGYEISFYLDSLGITYSFVTPIHLKRSMGLKRGKSDKVDATAIAYYCYLHRDELVTHPSKSRKLLFLKELIAERKRYVKQKASLQGYLTEYEEREKSSIYFRAEQSKRMAEENIKEIEKEIISVILSDKELKRSYELLTSIVGIGLINAICTIIHTNNFGAFSSARAYACYVGVAPFEYSSGTSIRGKTKVSQIAAKGLKAELTQAANSAICHDKELKAYYRRKIKEGKKQGVVKNAIKFKLIERMFAVIKRNSPFVRLGGFAA
ncbi:MAG: IS110 family transposase [Tannerellaceae bacterium]|nr:IS110 family transposase [Tannerellaceae bacterium]